MRRIMLAIAMIALWTTGQSDIAAQETRLSPGTDVRLLVSPSRDIRGDLIGWDADTLRLQDPGSGFVHVVPTLGIERLRVSEPRTRGGGALRGLMIGSIVGALSLGVVAAVAESGCTDFCVLGPGGAFLAGAIVGGAGGGGVGAAVGSLLPGRRWVDVALQP